MSDFIKSIYAAIEHNRQVMNDAEGYLNSSSRDAVSRARGWVKNHGGVMRALLTEARQRNIDKSTIFRLQAAEEQNASLYTLLVAKIDRLQELSRSSFDRAFIQTVKAAVPAEQFDEWCRTAEAKASIARTASAGVVSLGSTGSARQRRSA